MPSFINLMVNDVWTAADIKNRLHAEIRSEISEQAETELNRALQGAIMQMHTLTTAEQQALIGFKAATDRASAMGVAARTDWVLLNKTMAHEAAVTRLALPVKLDNEEDAAARTEAQSLVDEATPDVVALAALRYAQHNPPVPPMVAEPDLGVIA